jgi:hypothetical protein
MIFRKVVWSLLGLSLLFTGYASAATLKGSYCTSDEAVAACTAYYDGVPSGYSIYQIESGDYYKVILYQTGHEDSYVLTYGTRYWRYPANATGHEALGCSGTYGDSDGDGIPDDADYWPDDETIHLVRLVGYYTDGDNDIIVTEVWETDDGTLYSTGELPEEMTDPQYTSVSGSAWETPDGEPITDADFPDPGGVTTTSEDEKSTDAETATPDTDTGTGTDSESGDTDSELAAKIADNTSGTNTGVGKLVGYAEALNTAVGKIKGNTSSIKESVADVNENVSDIEQYLKERDEDSEDDANDGLTSIGDLDVDDYYNSSNFTGELVSGTDYDEAEGLSEQTWLSTFLSSNPYQSALSSSGFECNEADCEMTLTVLGENHTLSVCDLDAGFQAAGVMLLSLTTLGGFILLVRG